MSELLTAIESHKTRSAWELGVKEYARELIQGMIEENGGQYQFGQPLDKKALLNGAKDWKEYSEGGCSLIYDYEIAERVCSPSELKKCKRGERNPNNRETWLDVQARALYQAERLIFKLAQ